MRCSDLRVMDLSHADGEGIKGSGTNETLIILSVTFDSHAYVESWGQIVERSTEEPNVLSLIPFTLRAQFKKVSMNFQDKLQVNH